ncbi:MAG: amidohydrolase family protein [Solirubrobacteraceae bacterium]
MPINGSVVDPRLAPVYFTGHDELAAPLWFDAHTHMGQNDPDGRKATPEEILEGLEAARHDRALLFAMHEPDGYSGPNDAVLEACARSGGRLLPLSRIAPNHNGALTEAERCLAAGTKGFKLHPRSDEFGLPHPAVEQVVALAHEARAPVLFHAGRGIPHLGEAVVDLARSYPGARLILAHAGISDLGWIAAAAAELPNLFFDTAWWQVADQLQLYATIPPGQILYASDMPYGPGTFASFMFRRVSTAVGLNREQRQAIAGGQLDRIVHGEDPVDMGPAPGLHAVGERVIEAERVVAYCSIALQLGYRGIDPSEAIALARVACRTCREGGGTKELLQYVDRILEIGQEEAAAEPEKAFAAVPAALLSLTLAGTPEAGVPDVPLD